MLLVQSRRKTALNVPVGFGVMSVVRDWVSVVVLIGVGVMVSFMESFVSPPKFGEIEHIFLNSVIVVQHWEANVVVLRLEAHSWVWDNFCIGIWERIICWLNNWVFCDLVVNDCWSDFNMVMEGSNNTGIVVLVLC